MTEIRLLLVDDHQVVRSGLRMLLENQADMVIVGEASAGLAAIDMLADIHADVVVMDITLPDISGIQAARRIKEQYPQAAVVALTIHEDEQYFFEMLQAGASGYVPKRAAPEDLISAIRSAHAGQIYLYPSLAKLLVQDYMQRRLATAGEPPGEATEALSGREEEVLGMLAEGWTNEAIAEKLSISHHTVARHRENIMRKLGLHSRSELVKYAIRQGLIRP